MEYSPEDFAGMERIPEDFDYQAIDLQVGDPKITIGSSGLITFNEAAASLYLHSFEKVALFPHKEKDNLLGLRLFTNKESEGYPIKRTSKRKSESVSCKDFLQEHSLLPPKTGKKSTYETKVKEFTRGAGFLVLEVLKP